VDFLWTFFDMKKSSDYAESMFEFARLLGQQSDFQQILRLVASHSAQTLHADLALILMLNPDTRKTVKTIFKDGKTIEQKQYRNIHIHVGGWIINNKQSFLSKHIQNDKRFEAGLFDKIPIKAVAGAPLIIEGTVIGALMLLYLDSGYVDHPDPLHSLENLTTICAPYLRNAQKIRAYFDRDLPETSLLVKYNNGGLYGRSSRFMEMLRATEAATRCDARVLLIGATGTGKELIARAIHNFSSRAHNPFVAVDCGAIPANLLESEFFGYVKGAYTGAHSDSDGLFVQSESGTLFMDEINNLPLEMQTKLLRVLEANEIRPLGSKKLIKTDVRIIAASSVPLKKLVDDHNFREDLFYRLHVYPIYIPDLNERRDDIPFLAKHFLDIFAKNQDKQCDKFHDQVVDFICNRPWHGNIRELENFVERIVTLAPENINVIDAGSFPEDLKMEFYEFQQKHIEKEVQEPLREKVQEFEADIIRQTLIDCNWNQSEAARRLDTTERNIRYKIAKYDIRRKEMK
jgi:two-component system NtrC family response regulator